MNKTYILGLVLSGMLGASACTDDLDQEPITSKVQAGFLRNETEVEEYVNATYGALQAPGLYGLNLPVTAEISSDNTFSEVPQNDDGIYGQLDQLTTIPTNVLIAGVWQAAYVAIQRTNVVLNRIEGVPYAAPATREARAGEMKFLRALLYFDLVRLYGDVPLATQETTDPNVYFGQGRAPAAEVYTQIVKDLTEAIPVLPPTSPQAGRVRQTAAQTLLAKVYLTQRNYAAALPLLQAVVASGRHALQASPATVFALNNENNPEIIFAVQFASGLNGNTLGSIMFQYFSPSGTVSGAKGHNLPTRALYALYSPADRRRGTYLDVTNAGTPYLKKLAAPATVVTDGGSDFVVLRYADVLLMLAEVQNELNDTAPAAATLNLVRTRAGLAATAATTQADLRAAIDLERRLELVGEGHRWFDLQRTGTAVAVMNAYFQATNTTITIDDHHLLLPVPQSQINTDPAITQNPGY